MNHKYNLSHIPYLRGIGLSGYKALVPEHGSGGAPERVRDRSSFPGPLLRARFGCRVLGLGMWDGFLSFSEAVRALLGCRVLGLGMWGFEL